MRPEDTIIQEMVEASEGSFSLREINQIAEHRRIRLRYENLYPKTLYSLILLSLSHTTYPEDEAKALWQKILEHMRGLNEALGREVGLSVATLDYLSNIKEHLDDPTIIEEQKSKEVTKVAIEDELTGLYVRDVFDVTLKREMERAKRNKQELCLALLDLDDFKQINDQHGHLEGDEVLRQVGGCIQQPVREMDLAARYGGDEFAIIMPNADLRQGSEVCERVRQQVSSITLPSGAPLGISIGLGSFNDSMTEVNDFLEAADNALYQAKDAGRNRVSKATE